MNTGVTVVILDMAGTTISDDGVVLEAFEAALADSHIAPGSHRHSEANRVVRETMGQSKVEVFRRVLNDESQAQRATFAFERAYEDAVRASRVRPIPGAESVLATLRASGRRICLTTGFSAATRDLLLTELGWEKAVDLALSPADAGRGRPHPDLLWEAMLRLSAGSVDEVAAVGDTASDMQAARRAGVGLRCGVLTGADDEARLREGGATHVLNSINDLLDVL